MNDKSKQAPNANNILITAFGVTVYIPSINRVVSLILLIISIFAMAWFLSYIIHKYPEHFNNLKSDLESFNISIPITFNEEHEAPEEVVTLSKKINELLKKDENKRLQISFWTPNENTWTSIRTKTDDNEWQKNISVEKNMLFLDQVMRSGGAGIFSGLRNYEVCGKGEETYKCGLWWVATANKNIRLNEFIDKYQKFWNNSPGMYMELNIVNSLRTN